jgi:hypothetical protein
MNRVEFGIGMLFGIGVLLPLLLGLALGSWWLLWQMVDGVVLKPIRKNRFYCTRCHERMRVTREHLCKYCGNGGFVREPGQ